jgi:hypothetical protein
MKITFESFMRYGKYDKKELENLVDQIGMKFYIPRKKVCDILIEGYKEIILDGDFENDDLIEILYEIKKDLNEIRLNKNSNINYSDILSILDLMKKYIDLGFKDSIDVLEYGYRYVIDEYNEDFLESLKKAKSCAKNLKTRADLNVCGKFSQDK